MSQYTEDEINRIITDCENLIVVDDTASVDGSEKLPQIVDISKIKNPKNVLLTRYINEQSNTEEHFEQFFNQSKQKRACKQVAEIVDYKDILSVSTDPDQKNSPENALWINNMLRKRLILFRENIEASLNKVERRLKFLEQFLEDAKSNDVKDALSFKTTYIKCGRPYFKDALYYPAPENDDFKYRKNVLNEFFPFDLPSSNVKWRTKEKVSLVNGIKHQMINHIKIQQSKKICQDTRKTKGKLQKLRYISNNQDLNELSVSKLYETIQTDYPDFQINWNLISFNDLQSTHTVTECMGMWYSYLKPDINRDPFTDEENAILSQLAIENKYQNWEIIAQGLDRRTSLQTFSYFSSECSRFCPLNVRWKPEEDEELLEAVRKFTRAGVIPWNKIGSIIPNRNKTQCYNRYLILNQNLNVKKGVFSTQENRILLNYVAKYGEDFSKMPQDLLPNRSIVQIKNHYKVALKHKGKVNPWKPEEDKKLMDFVQTEGTNNWKKISDILQTHNRLSCRTRYLTISKFLSKNPNKSIQDVPSRLKTLTAVHKAINSDSEEEDVKNDHANRSKSFGVLSFEEFKMKNFQLYNLMKTTFNYKLVPQELNPDFTSFLMLKSFLGIGHYGLQKKFSLSFTDNQYNKINEILATSLEKSLEAEIIHAKRTYDLLIPLNYYTAIGLRSVAIKVHEESIDTTKKPESEPKTDAYNDALKSFQQLFMSLFYWPAMLSKLDPTEIIHYKNLKNQAIFESNGIKLCNINNPGSSKGILEQYIKQEKKRPKEHKVYSNTSKKLKIEEKSL